jgi:outer membrane immunogenic protein
MPKMNKLYGAAIIAASACLGGTAYAADAFTPYVPPVAYAPEVSSGGASFYLGVHGGYGWGESDHDGAPPNFPDGYDDDLSGWLAGAQAGVNFTLGGNGGVFVGVEVDGTWSDIDGTLATGGLPGDITHDIDWFGSARAKLGVDMDGFRPYVTGGFALASITREAEFGTSDTNVQGGWTAGLGVDIPVAEQVSLNLEYRYSDYGSAEFDTGGIPATVATTAHTVRAGINFEF